MADSSGLWSRNINMQKIDPNEKLFLFGYSCKIFRDDEKAKYIDQGKHLIPWMGDESLMIDRYDVRGYLHDLKQYEPSEIQAELPDSEEEKLCDEERYRSLRADLTEEQLYQEEELKRLRAAVASDGAYHEIGFSYDNEVQKEETVGSKVEEPEDEPYEPPEGLNIPKGIQVPSNMKIHAIIEKTSLFVCEQGGQMEIIIKMKQQHNPQFGFMHLDNPLYPYYKYLTKEIKSGSYKPIQTKKASRSEDEDDDHYLHPSLLSGKKENVPKFTVPSINFKRSQDDSYAVLVRNLQQQFAEEKLKKEKRERKSKQAKQEKKEPTVQEKQSLVNYTVDESQKNNSQNNSTGIVLPPSDIQPIIQKMAEYVAKNGEDFEYVVKSKKDKRFEFLETSSEYYAYYLKCRNEAKLIFQPPPPPPPDINNDAAVSCEQSLVSDSYSAQSAEGTYSVQSDSSTIVSKETVEQKPEEVQPYDEFDALYTQDSQDAIFPPEPPLKLEFPTADFSNSDSLDSVGAPNEIKSKSSKLKGPICFSLKPKESDNVPPEKLKIPLLLDDSDEEEGAEGVQKEKSESSSRKSTDDYRSAPNSRHHSVEKEEKPKLTSEMEAKLAEDRMKDKLFAAARERLVQQKKEKRLEMERQAREEQLKKDRQMQLEQQMKEKQLQLERKKKAALFLKMLKKRDPELDTIEGRLGAEKKARSEKSNKDFWNSSESSRAAGNGVMLTGSKIHISTTDMTTTAIPGIKNDWTESSASEESGEEIMITEFCSEPGDAVSEVTKVPEPTPEPEKAPESTKYERKKKKKKRSRSRSRDRPPKSYRSRDRHRSRSPRNHKHEKSKKEKQLPAAYALVRSRSRSRSPRRYRQNPSYWGRRR